MTLPAKFVERVLCDLGEAEGRALCAALDGVRHRVFRLLGLDRLAAWLGERIDRLLGRA